MKKIFGTVALVICFAATHAQGYKITVHSPDYKGGQAYLAYHFGNKLNAQDSGIISAKGTVVFSGKEKLLGGIYVIVFPGKTQTLDFLIDKSQDITIKADTTDLINKTIITGAPENTLFQQYQKEIAPEGKLLEKEREAYGLAKTKQDSDLHVANYSKINKELSEVRETYIAKYPESMLAVLLKAMREPKY